MSFQNLQTNEVYSLTSLEPAILGRGKYGLNDPYTSRQHVKITLLYNGKCFVEKLSDNMAKLNSAHLPEKKEIEAYDQDVLEIPVNNLFRLNLPKSSRGVYRPTSIVNNKQESDDDDTDDEFEPLSLVEQTDSQFISAATLDQSMDVDAQEDNVQDNEHHQSSSDNTDDEQENDVQQVDDGHLLPSDGSISSESDLLGDY